MYVTHTILFLMITRLYAWKIEIPWNYFGSPEVFSGYLTKSEPFIDAFTLYDDHLTITGSIPEVEHALKTTNRIGKHQLTFKNSIRAALNSDLFTLICINLIHI